MSFLTPLCNIFCILYGLETSSILLLHRPAHEASTEQLRPPLVGRGQKSIKSLLRPEPCQPIPCIGSYSALGITDKPLPSGNGKQHDPTAWWKVHDHTSEPLVACVSRVRVGGLKHPVVLSKSAWHFRESHHERKLGVCTETNLLKGEHQILNPLAGVLFFSRSSIITARLKMSPLVF